MYNFSNLHLSIEMVKNLDRLGYKQMTTVQEKSLPYILDNKDLIVKAKTGSGKTATFGIPLLQRLNIKKFRVQSLVLCPTRELADQVAKELRMIAKFAHNIKILTLCGGSSFGMQLASLRHEAHIVVGTPGRILKHLNKNSLNLKNLKTLVLDEADRMLDMGFIEDIQAIINFTSQDRQTLLFSATYPQEIVEFSKTIQKNAINIETSTIEEKNKIIECFYDIRDTKKVDALVKILSNFNPTNTIIFANMKITCDELADILQNRGIDALALHGDMQQYDRYDVLTQFINNSCSVLVATDVAARGIDIKELSMVINYDIPHDSEIYTHRIGRTGRAGAEGLAITLYDNTQTQYIDRYIDDKRIFKSIDSLVSTKKLDISPKYITLVIEGGKKDKLSKGDILGALTSNGGLQGNNIGKIDIYDIQSYVAIETKYIDKAYHLLKAKKIKNKRFSSWIL